MKVNIMDMLMKSYMYLCTFFPYEWMKNFINMALRFFDSLLSEISTFVRPLDSSILF